MPRTTGSTPKPSPRALARLDRAMRRAGFEPVSGPFGLADHERAALAAELVDMSAIAERATTTLGTVKSWRNRHEDFPAPLVTLAIGPVFAWGDVAGWLAGRRAKPSADHSPAR
jgi:hypothetical protein